jgi:hypothetical protein
MKIEGSKNIRGSASQYYVAAELSRRSIIAALTTGNCPNTDILCSNAEGTRFAHVQVKTFEKGKSKCAVGMKAEKEYTGQFFWVLVGIPKKLSDTIVYYVIPAGKMSAHVLASFKMWAELPGHDPQNTFRAVRVPPNVNRDLWDIAKYEGRWDLIEDALSER